MFRSTIVGLALLISLLGTRAFATSSYLDRLQSSATVIVVVEITSTSADGDPLAGRAVAEADVIRVLKGSCPLHLRISRDPSARSVYPRLHRGIHIVFLRNIENGYYSPVDPSNPDLPALREPPTDSSGSSDTFNRIIAELSSVVSSQSASDDQRRAVLLRSYLIPQGSVVFKDALIRSLRLISSTEIRSRVIAALILRGESSQVAVAERLISENRVTPEERAILLYAIGNVPSGSTAAPSLTRLAQSLDIEVRRAAMKAMWHSADGSLAPALRAALNDSDRQVRFFAIRALAEVYQQPEWAPGDSEFELNEKKYVQYWKEWTATH